LSATPSTAFRTRVLAGEVVVGSFLNLGSALTAEIMAIGGFDWLVVDLEHGPGGEQEALAQIQAVAHTAAAPLVRVESVERPRFGRVLDLGAAGVVVPRIRSVDDARRAVEACRYSGSRGLARYNRAWRWGLETQEPSEVDAAIVCAVQIETAEALAAADAIAALEGVDVLFVGPTDLGYALGIEGGPDVPALKGRIAEVAQAAAAHGKAAGILVAGLEQAVEFRDLGFTFLGCASDSGLLARESRRVAEALRALKPETGVVPLHAKE
jgi:2-keto-3-deoxy-L-rhamnonate aldolase RhmA